MYGSLFQRLATEEGVDFELGGKESSFEELKSFYNFWMSFNTQKSFLWFELYKLSEATDRRMKRWMEKENRAKVELEKKKYNDCIRVKDN